MSQWDWDDQHCLLLIEAYKKRPILWDPKHLNYYNKDKKSKSWSMIADTMGCSTDEVKKKMANLLASFRREKKRMKTQCVGAERYITRWYAFKPLSFMLKIQKFNSRTALKGEILDDDELEQVLQEDYYYSEEYDDMDINSRENAVISQEHDTKSEEYIIPQENVPDSQENTADSQENAADSQENAADSQENAADSQENATDSQENATDSQDVPVALQEDANNSEECDVSSDEYDVNLQECDVSLHEYDDNSENNAVNSQKIENHETKIELLQSHPKPEPPSTLKRKIKLKLPVTEDRKKAKETVEIENDAVTVTKRLQSSDECGVHGQHEAQKLRVTKNPQLPDESGMYGQREPHKLRVIKSSQLAGECGRGVYGQHEAHKLRVTTENPQLSDECGRGMYGQHEAHKFRVTTESPQLSDECGVYGQHVAHKLRSYSNKTKNFVQHQINMILFRADMGEYDRTDRHPPLNSYYPPPAYNHR